jgi:hypothetical protein
MLSPVKPAKEVSQGALKMREWRARKKAGTQPIYEFICTVCGSAGASSQPQTKCCASCRPAARQMYARGRTGAVAIGTGFACRNCGTAVTKAHKRHFYCEGCRKLSAGENLPGQIDRKRAWFAKYGKERRASDPAYAIRGRMTANINNSLREGKGGRSWERLLGYTLADLMAHLERQFLPGMSWENRSEWHIDHRRPVSSFNFLSVDDPEFLECWALSNLQPLWAADNIRKGNALTHLL